MNVVELSIAIMGLSESAILNKKKTTPKVL